MESIYLEPMAEKHLEKTYQWLNRSLELRQQIDCLEPPTEIGNREHWQVLWQDTTREDYAIIVSLDKNHIGNCGLFHIDKPRRKAELWIYLAENYQQGHGTKALKALLHRAFEELLLNRVYLRVLANNQRAIQFYKKLKFIEEGRFRQDTYIGNDAIDAICMSMLKAEYQARDW